MNRFNQELQTVTIGDYDPVEKGETKRPFAEDIHPQGTVAPKFNKESKTAKFKYIESANHGRSIDEKATSGKVLWGGKFKCDKFGARDLKGARHENPAVKISKSADGYPEVRAIGLYDETDVGYLIKASEYLRSQGIPTENIVNIYHIHELIFDGKRMPIKEWALHNIIGHISKQKSEGRHDPEEIKQVTDFALNTNFFEVERELQVSERIRDLAVCQNKEEFIEIIGTPLKWINTVAKATNEGILPGTERPEFFNIDNFKNENITPEKLHAAREDIKRYLENWLPSQMGVYLGRCRKAGVKNDFDHAQQWSLAATEYDSQSFVGKEINGQELTEKDFVETLCNALGVLEELFDPPGGNYIKNEFGDDGEALENAKVNLLVNYFREIDFPNIESPNEYKYIDLIDNTFYNGFMHVVRSLKPDTYVKAMAILGFEFTDEQISAFERYHAKFNELKEEGASKQKS